MRKLIVLLALFPLLTGADLAVLEYTDYCADANNLWCYRFNEDLDDKIHADTRSIRTIQEKITGDTDYATGKEGLGLTFDGSDDKANFGDPSSVDSTDLSCTAWVKFDSVASDDLIMSKGALFAGVQPILWWRDDASGGSGNDLIAIMISDTDTESRCLTSDGSVASTDTWYHSAFTFDASFGADGLKCYLDGVEDGTASTSGNSGLPPNISTIELGDDTSFTGKDWAGDLDEMGCWDRVLTPEEITDIYTHGLR